LRLSSGDRKEKSFLRAKAHWLVFSMSDLKVRPPVPRSR
jgi:hypothetical protein